MTPEDLATLKFALANVNSPRSEKRMDATFAFRRLNKKYSRPVVDETRRKMEESK